MPNEPQKDVTAGTPIPAPSAISRGERLADVGVPTEAALPLPVEPSISIAPETIRNAPSLGGQTGATRTIDPLRPPEPIAVKGDFSHLPPENRLFGVAQKASNWIRRILGREGAKGKERLEAKTV